MNDKKTKGKDSSMDQSKYEDKRQIYYINLAYENVQKKLLYMYKPNEIASNAKIDAMDITSHMKDTLKEMLKKKPPMIYKKPDNKSNDKKVSKSRLLEQLVSITGIGPSKADDLIKNGLKNVSELTKPKFTDMLNTDTKAVLKLNPSQMVSWATIKELEPVLNSSKFKTQITGSYRREKPYSRDIDMLISGDIKSYLKWLSGRKIDTKSSDDSSESTLKFLVYSEGTDKASILIKYKPNLVIKMDIFSAKPGEYPAMLLYSTGSKQHNIRMRARAKKLNLLLNQTGLYKNCRNSGSDKVDHSKCKKINIRSEKGFFDALGMKYIDPKYRG